MNMDFDEWHRLSREDPALFERRKAQMLEALIASARHPARLRRLAQALRCMEVREGAPGEALAVVLHHLREKLDAEILPALEALRRSMPFH